LNNPFQEWLMAQYELEVNSFGNDPPALDVETRKDFFRWNAFALEDELHEAAQEIAWKPWATTTHLNRQQFLQELVDVMFFLGNIVLLAAHTTDGTTCGDTDIEGLAEELWSMYQAKVQVNADRMKQGYDGVTGKCPNCHRELVSWDKGDGPRMVCPICIPR
jgi:hypothetical protein